MSNRITTVLIALAASLAAPIAAADYVETLDGGFVPIVPPSGETMPGPSTVTREEVRQEVSEARRDGTLMVGQERESDEPLRQGTAFGWMTREEVRAEQREWESNPVTPNGFREVGGERGWVYEGD